MSICVFVGPTLAVAEARTVLEATYLPPARQGDVYRAVSLLGPRAVGIVDGYFQWAPAVWHKEILWAIDRGVHVFGAASMGALRAAELAPFGMRGVGLIFEAYRDGVLAGSDDEPFEDDDEVAVVHGPPESGYVVASEAMVNIRCTLAGAVREGVIDDATRARLLAIAKARFFPERSYRLLLEQARAARLPEAALGALERWLPSGRVNQKRADALAMLEAMRDFIAGNPSPARAGFAFERTTLWERAVAALQPATVHDPVEAAVLDELRLDAARHDALRQQALRSLIETEQPHVDVVQVSLDIASAAAEGERHLEWAARREAERRVRAQIPTPLVERKLLALLRKDGSFEELRARAERKAVCLAALPALPEVEDFSELQLLELRDWYFSKVVGADMPDELGQWLRESGHADLARFHRSIFAEYVYRSEESGRERASVGR
jgi:hypothetical protein